MANKKMENITSRDELISLIISTAARCGFTQIGRRMKLNLSSSLKKTFTT